MEKIDFGLPLISNFNPASVSFSIIGRENLFIREIYFLFTVFQLGSNLFIDLRLPEFEAEIFQFTFYGIKSKPVGKRGIKKNCFSGHLHLFMLRHRIESSHIMQTVSNLDENDPQIIRKGKKHLPEVLSLQGR